MTVWFFAVKVRRPFVIGYGSMIYGCKVFLDCQSFSSQGTVPIRDTPSRVSFHVSERHLGSRHVFSVCDTSFWWKKPVSRTGNRGKTCYFVCDTPFLQKYLVSRAEKGAVAIFPFATHPQGLVFMCRSGIWVQGMCFLSAIHPFCRNTLCRVQRKGAVAIFPSTIHLF